MSKFDGLSWQDMIKMAEQGKIGAPDLGTNEYEIRDVTTERDRRTFAQLECRQGKVCRAGDFEHYYYEAWFEYGGQAAHVVDDNRTALFDRVRDTIKIIKQAGPNGVPVGFQQIT